MRRFILANITAAGWVVAVAVILAIAAIAFSGRGSQESAGPTGERTMKIEVYFSNSQLEPKGAADCTLVYPVTRVIPRNPDIGRAALLELLQGPTPDEAAQGYTSVFSDATQDILVSLRVAKGVAYVDFQDFRSLIPNASASCGGQQFRSQVEATLKQFPAIGQVRYAINKIPQTFYEFMQLACDWKGTICDGANFP